MALHQCGGTMVRMSPHRAPLEIRSFSLASGRESVGLPVSRSRDTVLVSYLDLLGRIRPGVAPTVEDFRQDDMDALAGVTGLDSTSVLRRLKSMSATQ